MKLTFNEYISSFLMECECKDLSEQTTEWYKKKLVAFGIFLRDKYSIDSPLDATKEHLKAFIYALKTDRERDLSVPYIRGFGRTLSVFYNYLESEYGIDNPSTGLTLPKMPQKHFPILTEADIAKLLRAPEKQGLAGYTHYSIMYTLLDTGMRVGELVSFKTSDINIEDGFIRVFGKGSKDRLVPMGKELKRALLKYKTIRPSNENSDIFFLNAGGRPYTRGAVGQFIRRYGRREGISGVRVSPHTFRHTFATMYILNGGDSYSLQRILGHSTPAIVQVYVNMTAKNIIEQHKKFSPGDSIQMSSSRV